MTTPTTTPRSDMSESPLGTGSSQTSGSGAKPSAGALSRTTIGLLAGLVLGTVAAFGGFDAFLLALVFAAVGLVVGLALDGRIDVPSLIGRVTERR